MLRKVVNAPGPLSALDASATVSSLFVLMRSRRLLA
jgi:hypothetical protein